MSDEDGLVERILDSLDPFGTGQRYFNRDGEPITLWQSAVLGEDDDYKSIASDRLDANNVWVSTVWLGLNHNFALVGPPLIFETMVFVRSTEEQLAERRRIWVKLGLEPRDFPWEDLQCERYATEDEAREGHRRIVDSLRMRMDLLVDDPYV